MYNTARIAALCLVIAGFTTARLPAQDYALYGDLELGTVAVSDPNVIAAASQLTLNHSLSYDWGELRARHSLTAAAFQQLPAELETALELETAPEQELLLSGDTVLHHITQLYIAAWPLQQLTMRAGRHSLPWSYGYAFFPADRLHPEHIPGETPAGFDGASLSWHFNRDWTGHAAVRLDSSTDQFRYAAQLQGFLLGFESSLSLLYQPDSLLMPAWGASAELLEFVIHGEGSINLDNHEYLLSSGIQRVWSADRHSLTLLTEYQYTSAEDNHHVYPHIAYDYDTRYTLQTDALIAIHQNTAAVQVAGSHYPADTIELSFAAYLSVGPNTSPQFEAAKLGIKLYF